MALSTKQVGEVITEVRERQAKRKRRPVEPRGCPDCGGNCDAIL
jgi:hypothetical protein